MQAAVKHMLQHHIQGNILNIASVAAYEPATGAYGASKTAAAALTRGWGKKFAPHHITINGIAPGLVATDMINWKKGDPLESKRVPYGRLILPEEIASLALHMLDESSKMICGELIVLDGAYSIR